MATEKTNLAPYIIPIFIPHEGCPHRCVYCNQRAVTGRQEIPDAAAVSARIDSWLARIRNRERPVQVAFYGGSFTALPRARQQELLAAVEPFLDRGEVAAIRLSTRPDYMDGETAGYLLSRGVRVVELGVQSMDQEVLAVSGRKYTAERVREACGLLRHAGITVGCQLMLGLPGDTATRQLAGIRQLLALRPDFLRLYPTLVLEGSQLAAWYRQDKYRPLSLGRAVALTARIKPLCDAAGVRVVRMGLQPSLELEQHLLAGPYHPAFGELVLSRLLFNAARKVLAQERGKGEIRVAAADESIFRGPGNINLKRLASLGLLKGKTLAFGPLQPRQTILVRR